MWEQSLPYLCVRTVFVNCKLFGDGVTCDDGLEVVPSTSKEPINLCAPAVGGITVKSARKVDAGTRDQRERPCLHARSSPALSDEFSGLL